MGKSTVVIFVRISEWQANHFVDFLLKFLIIKKKTLSYCSLFLDFPCVCVFSAQNLYPPLSNRNLLGHFLELSVELFAKQVVVELLLNISRL